MITFGNTATAVVGSIPTLSVMLRARQARLLQALWAGVARLEPATNEVAVGGLRYSVKLDAIGAPIVHPRLDTALTSALPLPKWKDDGG